VLPKIAPKIVGLGQVAVPNVRIEDVACKQSVVGKPVAAAECVVGMEKMDIDKEVDKEVVMKKVAPALQIVKFNVVCQKEEDVNVDDVLSAGVENIVLEDKKAGKNKVRDRKDQMRKEINKIEKDRKVRTVAERKSDLFQASGSREYAERERAVLRTFIKDPKDEEKRQLAKEARVEQFLDVMGHDGIKVEVGHLSFDMVALYAAKLVSRGFKSVHHYIGPVKVGWSFWVRCLC
jgi:hypothetical protein